MNRLAVRLLLPLIFLAGPALAALQPGAKAPDFTAAAAVGGKDFTFSLKRALKHGPVVLYFFPKAFTKGCTAEAHDFADAAAHYKALGATLIGMSGDTIATLHQFSTMECRASFPVAADPDLGVISAYDVLMKRLPGGGGLSNRTSFVIAPDHRILYAYTANDPDQHVANTLAVVQRWRATHPG
jgi:peroxiredoxin Q/BCP